MYSYNSSSMSIVQQRKLAEAAEKALAPIPTLTGVLEHLDKHKPGYLNYGEEHWIDKRQLDEKYKGLRDKLTIHGFGDRAERLRYLRSVMEKKWVNKMNSYKCIMTLLSEMSDRPCDNNELIVCTRVYSETPVEEEDEDSLLESDSEEALELERKRAEFKEHVLEDLRETRVEVMYSSDSDLSDWAASDVEQDESFHNVSSLRTLKSERLFQTSPRLRLPRLSLDFSFQVPTEAEKRRQSLKAVEIRRQEAERHWNTQEINAVNFLHQSIRHVEPIPLTFQPVISSLLLLHSRFGEYWEWKRRAAEEIKTQRLIIMENDIIHEILWQFTSPNTNKSIIFAPDWTIKPEIMISSLSQTILQSIVNKFGKVLSKLKNMKDFIANIERDCYGIGISGSDEETEPKLPQPQMYRVYAHSLTQVLTLVCSDVNEIERNLKKSRMEPIIGYQPPPVIPCTTLLQLDSQLRNCILSIDILESLHTQSTTSETDIPNWLKSLKLISCLEAHLGLEERPRIYGLVLYLFAKSLVCFLQELLGLVETVKWKNTDFLFQKSTEVKIEDAHFWENLITVQPFEEKLKSLNVMPFSCLKAILPKFLNVLKVLEMISQIQEGFKLMLHGAVPIYELIVEDFINQLLRTNPVQIQDSNENSSVDSLEEPNYERHFMFLGLQNSMVANAFDYILDESPKKVKKQSPIDLHLFNSITEIPIESISVCLDRIFVQSLQPYLNSSQKAFKKLFLDYDVEGAMRVFREIIFSGREDFALDVIQLSGSITKEVQTENPQEIQRKRNAKYQMLLDKYYPDGRSLFDIRFILDVRADTNVRLDIKPNFPLNLILTPSAIKAYTLISHQLHRIRKSVWILTQLRFKMCKAINGVSLNRMFVFRHCLLHFCSSFRNYLLIALFSKDITVLPNSDEYFDINEIRSAHEKDLHGSLCRLLSNQIVNSIVIRDIVRCSSYLEQYWAAGISMPKMVKLESVLQKNWKTVADWGDRKYPSAMNELSHYFPPTPDIFG